MSFAPGASSVCLGRCDDAVEIPAAAEAVGAETRRWCAFAVGSLVIAGLLSLSVVLGRLPGVSRIIDDPLFFKRCLVVHVDLALVVWFDTFLAALLALNAPRRKSVVRRGAFVLAAGGVIAMLAGALMRGAQPVLSNYIPAIDHPLFAAGLAAFVVGILANFVDALIAPLPEKGKARGIEGLPRGAVIGFQAAAILVVLAGATWVSAYAGLPTGLDAYTRAEFLSWGPGHVLQAANTCAMLAVWLWLLTRATGTPALSPRVAWLVFLALGVPQFAMPLLTLSGTLDPLYHNGATQLMRWGIFPAVVVVLAAGTRHLWLHRAAWRKGGALRRAAFAGFGVSAGLALLGLILGACIRGSTTLVPAHYHASLGAVTAAFMAAAYLIVDGARCDDSGRGLDRGLWRSARRQLLLYGGGQAVFALAFGLCGLQRKTYAGEQHVRTAGEVAGLVVMGIGGLVAVTGGVWFLFLVLREMREWWTRRHGIQAGSTRLSPVKPATITTYE